MIARPSRELGASSCGKEGDEGGQPVQGAGEVKDGGWIADGDTSTDAGCPDSLEVNKVSESDDSWASREWNIVQR